MLQVAHAAMAERPRELDQRFQLAVNLRLFKIEGLLFASLRHDAISLTHHMVIELFLLLGLAAGYRSPRRRRWCGKHCGRPSGVHDTTGEVS